MNEFEKHYSGNTEAIELHGVTFHVTLPTTTNKRYQRAVMNMVVDYDLDSGDITRKDITPGEMVEIQIEQFVRTCIKRVDGWDDFSTDKLLAMDDACEDLWDAASSLAMAKNAEAEVAVKKSQPTSPGQGNGATESSSTSTLKKAAG